MTLTSQKTKVPIVIPTNQEVADRLGLTHSAISRIRSGQRLPSFQVMNRIATEYDWPLKSQVEARIHDTYAEQFEMVICGVQP